MTGADRAGKWNALLAVSVAVWYVGSTFLPQILLMAAFRRRHAGAAK